jgi:G3E family GTPase
VYRARRPFDPLKLYRALEGKLILLQDEADDDEDEEMSDDVEEGSNNAEHSDSASEDSEDAPLMDTSEILANKKACPLFQGLHRSKGIFWLATRPDQMGSWSTAGAMLTLGSDMPWFCTVSDDEWMADEDTMKNIKADFEGAWGDRRQELVLIGEELDVEGLTQMLDGCLLSRAEMRKWERVMHDNKLKEDEKEERLQEIWDDSYWAEWV